jgi:hypothetical protein
MSASYFAAKECTYTDSSGRPVPAPLASKNDKPPRTAPSQSRRRLQRDSYSGSPVSASASSLPSTRGEPLTSLQDPPDARDDHAETSKRPRLGSFPSSECQAPASLPSRSTFAATRFEVSVVRELVNRTYLVFLRFPRSPLTPFKLSVLCALSSPPSPHPPSHLHGRRQSGTHPFLLIIRLMCTRRPFLQTPYCTDGSSSHCWLGIRKSSPRSHV